MSSEAFSAEETKSPEKMEVGIEGHEIIFKKHIHYNQFEHFLTYGLVDISPLKLSSYVYDPIFSKLVGTCFPNAGTTDASVFISKYMGCDEATKISTSFAKLLIDIIENGNYEFIHDFINSDWRESVEDIQSCYPDDGCVVNMLKNITLFLIAVYNKNPISSILDFLIREHLIIPTS